MTNRETKALKLIAKQIKELDQNAILLEDIGVRPEVLQARLLLFDALTKKGYSLEMTTYKLIKK